MDFKCIKTSDNEMTISDYSNNNHMFKVYRVMEFDSDRKRMSILLRDPTDNLVKLFIKGADSIILSRLD